MNKNLDQVQDELEQTRDDLEAANKDNQQKAEEVFPIIYRKLRFKNWTIKIRTRLRSYRTAIELSVFFNLNDPLKIIRRRKWTN